MYFVVQEEIQRLNNEKQTLQKQLKDLTASRMRLMTTLTSRREEEERRRAEEEEDDLEEAKK